MPSFQEPLKNYKPGDWQILAKDMNNIQKRLAILEKMEVGTPLEMEQSPTGRVITLNKNYIEMQFVELQDDLPPFGCARASLVLYKPTNTGDIDRESFSSVLTPLEGEDDSGFVRGERDRLKVIVYDNYGVGSNARTRGWAYVHPDTYDGRSFFQPNYTADQYFFTLQYTNVLDYHQLTIPPPMGGNNEWVRYCPGFSSNLQHDNAKAANWDSSIGGDTGDGWAIQILHQGIYHVQANFYARRIDTPSGADLNAKFNNSTYLRVRLQTACSTSGTYITLDEGVVEAPPISGRGGTIYLQSKGQMCHPLQRYRVRVEVVGTSGGWEIVSGGIHFQRSWHPSTDTAAQYSLDTEGVVAGNIINPEGSGLVESNEDMSGEFDETWVNGDGPTPPKHNYGYPTNDNYVP